MERNCSHIYPEGTLGAYLQNCEGKIWRAEDTALILRGADQLDDLVKHLMRMKALRCVVITRHCGQYATHVMVRGASDFT
jgi:hypothetical protein